MSGNHDTSMGERRDGFTVAGVAQHDTDVDPAALWEALDRQADELDDVAVGDDQYGVLFDLQEGSRAYTYLAGYEVESTDDLPPELTAVAVPEGVYAVFTPSGDSIDEVVEDIESAEFGSDAYVGGLMYEHYPPGEDPTDEGAPLELHIPVAGG